MNVYKLLTIFGIFLVSNSTRADLPTYLSDKIFEGEGAIDILEDVSASELESYIQAGNNVFFGVDLNESSKGLESGDSVGVAIKEINLEIQTTEGSYSFTDFYTNTTAAIVESGASAADDYYTLFGRNGSSQLTPGTVDFGGADDVITINNVTIEGEIQSATLDVSFLDTNGSGANEEFFDYSAGFEDFALVSAGDGTAIDASGSGVSDSPGDISFTVAAPTGTPEPWWFFALLIPVISYLKRRSQVS